MNIESNFNIAKSCLCIAHVSIARQDYEAALAALSKTSSHTRAMLEQVIKLQALKVEAERPAGEDSGGP
jgi:hypothetical protein